MSQPEINVIRMYMKGASLEHPAAPAAFLQDPGQAEQRVDINVGIVPVASDIHEVAVRATLTLSIAGKDMMVLEVEQAGMFRLTDVPVQEIEAVLATQCVGIVFSYLRVNFADVMTRTSLAPFHLPEPNWVQQFQNRPRAAAGAANDSVAANDVQH